MSQETLNGINSYVEEAKSFGNDSIKFLRKCSKPDRKGNASLDP
jgi:protein transport protein SEC61 subunit gamma and related proteins